MAIRVNFALSEQKTDQNNSKKQNQNSLLLNWNFLKVIPKFSQAAFR